MRKFANPGEGRILRHVRSTEMNLYDTFLLAVSEVDCPTITVPPWKCTAFELEPAGGGAAGETSFCSPAVVVISEHNFDDNEDSFTHNSKTTRNDELRKNLDSDEEPAVEVASGDKAASETAGEALQPDKDDAERWLQELYEANLPFVKHCLAGQTFQGACTLMRKRSVRSIQAHDVFVFYCTVQDVIVLSANKHSHFLP